MATYKKGFKKQTSEQILLKVIVGIVITVFMILIIVFLYDLLTTTRTYDDFDKIDTYATVLSQEDESGDVLPGYLVYFYSDSCVSCESIKEDALKLAKKAEDSGVVIFFVNIDDMTDEDTAKDTFLLSIDESSLRTPMIITVVGGEFEDKFVGTDPVLSILTDVKNGDYAPFN